jgi:hypothetical protein
MIVWRFRLCRVETIRSPSFCSQWRGKGRPVQKERLKAGAIYENGWFCLLVRMGMGSAISIQVVHNIHLEVMSMSSHNRVGRLLCCRRTPSHQLTCGPASKKEPPSLLLPAYNMKCHFLRFLLSRDSWKPQRQEQIPPLWVNLGYPILHALNTRLP